MNSRNKRIKDLVLLLEEKNGASIKELSSYFDVSEMTIRRDLNILKKDNIVNVVHGAAIFNDDSNGINDLSKNNDDYNIRSEKEIRDIEKNKIGRIAASLINPGDTIIIDTGTTTEKLARYIPTDFPITVVCFNLNTINEVYNKGVDKLIIAGGFFQPNTQMFMSQEGIDLISKIRSNKLFLSAAGIHKDMGLTCFNEYEVNMKKACINSSIERILLMDSSKFDAIKPSFFSKIDIIDTIITDSNIPEDWTEYLNERKIKIIST